MWELSEVSCVLWLTVEVHRMSWATEFVLELGLFTEMGHAFPLLSGGKRGNKDIPYNLAGVGLELERI